MHFIINKKCSGPNHFPYLEKCVGRHSYYYQIKISVSYKWVTGYA